MRILLTGAGGYIGLHILQTLLAHGHEVTALARTPSKLGPLAQARRLTIVTADLEHEAAVVRALDGHQVCVHAALLWGDPGSDLELRDTVVAARLFDAAGRAGVARSIYVSSAAVHRPFSGEMSEDDSLAPTDTYGATKAAAELFLRSACATHGMTGVAIRPGPVVGPPAFAGAAHRTDQRIAAMVAAARATRPIEVLEGDARQLSDVTAVAEIIRLLTEIEDPLPTYICADREVLAWEWIARTVVASLESRSEVRVLPRETDVPPPRFRTHRVEALLGKPMDARDALLAHIHHLARASQ